MKAYRILSHPDNWFNATFLFQKLKAAKYIIFENEKKAYLLAEKDISVILKEDNKWIFLPPIFLVYSGLHEVGRDIFRLGLQKIAIKTLLTHENSLIRTFIKGLTT